MSFFGKLLLILLALAAVIIIISILIYNRRLDKITRGEIHDTHNPVPEPSTTVSVLYKIILMIVIVIALFSISALSTTIFSMQSTLNNLSRTQNRLSMEVSDLNLQLKEQASNVKTYEWEFKNPNYDTLTGQLHYSVTLKKYSDNTSVALRLNGKDAPLSKESAGVYSGDVTIDFFNRVGLAELLVTEGGITSTEETDFPEYAFWEFLPTPSFVGTLESDYHGGKLKYSGSYRIEVNHLEDVRSASITYLSNGKELKTFDATNAILHQEEIELEKGLALEKDLTMRIELVSKNGFKTVQQTVIIYATEFDFENAEYFKVYDTNGQLAWESDQYQ